jgi:hypothetical protein
MHEGWSTWALQPRPRYFFVVYGLQDKPTREHAATPKFKCCTPPYGGEQERKGGKLPYPLKGILGAYPSSLRRSRSVDWGRPDSHS